MSLPGSRGLLGWVQRTGPMLTTPHRRDRQRGQGHGDPGPAVQGLCPQWQHLLWVGVGQSRQPWLHHWARRGSNPGRFGHRGADCRRVAGGGYHRASGVLRGPGYPGVVTARPGSTALVSGVRSRIWPQTLLEGQERRACCDSIKASGSWPPAFFSCVRPAQWEPRGPYHRIEAMWSTTPGVECPSRTPTSSIT